MADATLVAGVTGKIPGKKALLVKQPPDEKRDHHGKRHETPE
jgi:hypothetical protein